jgi:tRNA pseudouridine38-40 synthase
LPSRLLVEYDGSGFSGWSRQPGLRTVQEELERALAVVLRRSSVPVTVAGRTDTGVHAWGQVASYAGEPASVRGLNGVLPPDVSVLSSMRASDDFDARRDATSRAYCYRVLARSGRPALLRRRVLHWPYELDAGLLSQCAAALVGTHDFTAFTPTETEHVRFSRVVLEAFWRSGGEGACSGGEGACSGGEGACSGGEGACSGGELLEFWIEADAFMRQMNRVLVGTMLEVGAGRRSLAEFVELLEGRPRSQAGPTAPPHGLYLAGVGYGGERVLGGG